MAFQTVHTYSNHHSVSYVITAYELHITVANTWKHTLQKLLGPGATNMQNKLAFQKQE